MNKGAKILGLTKSEPSELPDPSAFLTEVWEIGKVYADPMNYRKHPPEQLSQLASSLRKRGFRKPIVVQKSTGMVIAGHGLLMAAQLIGLKDVVVAPWDCTDHEARSYLVADNELSRLAVDDDDMLNTLLADLAEGAGSPEDLIEEGIGFEFDELVERIDAPLAEQAITDLGSEEPATPDLPDDPETQLGDIWVLGDHRLICGDSTTPETYSLLMDDEKADLVFTDPPYGVSYSGKCHSFTKANKEFYEVPEADHRRAILNDELTGSDLLEFLIDMFTALPLNPGANIYCCHADSQRMNFEVAFKRRFEHAATIIWDKGMGSFGRQDYKWRHEPILYGWLEGSGRVRPKDKTETTIWQISAYGGDCFRTKRVHPTQKPVSLPRRAIINSSRRGDVILEPFGGSGSTLLAAEQVGRRCFAVELDPAFCDVIKTRWENMTGRKAIKVAAADV